MTLLLQRWTASRVLVALAFGAMLASGAFAQKVCMTAVLDGDQETPPVSTNARGTGFVVVDRAANTLSYELVWDGAATAETLAHIHGFAAPGVPAGIKFNLALGNHKTGQVTYVEADEASILGGLTYFNVHTVANSGGEIRGQILPSNAHFTMFCVADGAQETPPTGSAGKGVGWFEFDIVADSIMYSFTYSSLGSAETLAHIHGFAPSGTPAGILLNLPLGFHKNGALAYAAGDEANYLNELAYVNIHSTTFSGGEIRGQILDACSNPSNYCSSKVNSQGCMAQTSWTGLPTVGAPDDFHVTCTQALNNKFGMMFWSLTPDNTPFLGGTQCMQAPLILTAVQSSGGNPPPDDCSGTYDFHFTDAYMAANSLAAGSTIFCEYMYRDPVDIVTLGLSDAVSAEILP